MTPLLIGGALAILALVFVLQPLWSLPVASGGNDGADDEPTLDEEAATASRKRAVEALREVEFDRATGKLSEADYAVLREQYMAEAVAALRSSDNAEVAAGRTSDAVMESVDELVNRMRSALRSCPHCGPRPEPGAMFCSDCGTWLGGSCQSCGTQITESGARFCASCGAALAA